LISKDKKLYNIQYLHGFSRTSNMVTRHRTRHIRQNHRRLRYQAVNEAMT